MASLTSIGTVSKREIHCQSDKHYNFFKEGFIVSLIYIGTVSKREIYYKSNKECNIFKGGTPEISQIHFLVSFSFMSHNSIRTK